MSANGLPSRTWLLLLAGGLGSLAALAEPGISSSPQVARGEHLARLVCSACHVVAKDQEYPPQLTLPTPSFVEIANRPGVNTRSLQHFITNTHWDGEKIPMSMPNPGLNQNDVQAVSEYIMSLRRR
ncbi:MAG TPA: c-type cytochrome [Steroidobacteraceae bacterium]|nr:c-type cytochrome [Steroidobacteraceae bacterium]